MTYEFSYVRLGQANLEGATEALFRDQFMPELITQFDAKRIMKNYVRSKTISKGKSASFPVLGTTSAKYMGVGDAALGNQTIGHNEITINLNPLLVSDIAIHELDAKMQEYDDRAEITREMGRALANTEDKQLLIVGCLAARASAPVVGGNGGTVISEANMATDAATLAAAIYSAGVQMDVKNIPEEDRNCVVRPLQFAMLAQYENIADKNIGGGDYASGRVGELNNIRIIKSNHLPSANIAQGSDKSSPNYYYYGDFSKTVGLVFTREAVGTVSRAGLITEVSWNPERFHHLITARILQGHGILRPDCAVELKTT